MSQIKNIEAKGTASTATEALFPICIKLYVFGTEVFFSALL